MNRFSKLHPMMQFLYFLATFILLLSINNPIFSVISLVGAMLFCFSVMGKNALRGLKMVVLIILFVSLFNMLFAHYGNDVLFKIKSTEFTLEALFYGFNQGMVLSAVMLWFSALSRSMNSEHIIYIFRYTPKFALLFSMVLGFVPRFTKKLDDIRDARKGLNGEDANKKLSSKIKVGIKDLSALISYSLESSIITADSMEAREYNPKAVRQARFKFVFADYCLIALVVAAFFFVLIQNILNKNQFVFEPIIYIESISVLSVVAFLVLELLPFSVNLVEEIRWKLLNAKA